MWICPECRSLHDDPVPVCDRDGTPLAEVTAHQSKARYPLLGKVVGDRYHLIGGLGQGGLGTVYLAKHRHLNQLFAVKFLEVETIVAPGTEDEAAVKDQYRKDFLREAQVASLIRHEAVVRVSDFGEHGRMPFLVMEYVPGPSLLQVLGRQGRFETDEGLAIARRIAEALDAFHERRLVHRDLKPANVILDPRGNGKLTLVDLGLVKDLSGPGGKASTHPLALRGTPGYLAPEQVPAWVLAGAGVKNPGEKQPVDARVDLYALGVIVYEMLAGVSPYPDGSNTAVIVYTCTKEPIPITSVEPKVPLLPGLGELIHDTMARDPDRRPQTAAGFLERLDRITMGLLQAGSWPQLMLPDRRRRGDEGSDAPAQSPAASGERRPEAGASGLSGGLRAGERRLEAAPPVALLAPPSDAGLPFAETPSGDAPQVHGDGEDDEQTVVYDDLGGATSKPALLPPYVDRGDEEATMEADLDDSMEGLYDGTVEYPRRPAGGGSRKSPTRPPTSEAQGPGPRPSASAGRASVPAAGPASRAAARAGLSNDAPDGRGDEPPPTIESPALPGASLSRGRASELELPGGPSRAPAWIAAVVVVAASVAAFLWLRAPEKPGPEAVRVAVGETASEAAPQLPSSAPSDEPLVADVVAGAPSGPVGAPASAAPPASVPAPTSRAPAPPPRPAAPESRATAPASAVAPASAAARPRAPSSADARPRPPARADETSGLLDRARQALESKDHALALTLYQQALQRLDAEHPEYWPVRQRIDYLRSKAAPK